jgi:hypothetical protein
MNNPRATLQDIADTLERIEPSERSDDALIPIVREIIGDLIKVIIARQRGQNGVARAFAGDARMRVDELFSRVSNERQRRRT